MSPHSATHQDALAALDLLLGHGTGWLPVERHGYGRPRVHWHHLAQQGSAALLTTFVQRATAGEDEIQLRLPEREPQAGPTGATVLWARVEGREQCQRAARFRPMPSVVLREGGSSRRLLLWALESWQPYETIWQANRRIAYRLGAKQKDGRLEELRIPAPGTLLRAGRSRPVPVQVTRLVTDVWAPEAIVRRLRQPPEQRWRAAA